MPPSETEQQILREVVIRYLGSWEPTERNFLIRKFKDLDALNSVYQKGLIRDADNIHPPAYLPNPLAFHYCGDAKMEAIASRSIEIIATILKRQYLEDRIDPSPENLRKEVRNIDGDVEPVTTVRLGLYLARNFSFLQGYTGGTRQDPEIRPNGITEYVVRAKPETLWKDYVAESNPWREPEVMAWDSAQGLEAETILDQENIAVSSAKSRRVFIVHGRNHEAKEAAARLLERLHLEPVILHEQPNKGRTLIEKFEQHSAVGFALVLLTPDDVGGSADKPGELQNRARQNVVLELGYFIGKLGRHRVCALYAEGVERPSDIEGLVYISYSDGDWRLKVAKEIKAAGIELDFNLLSQIQGRTCGAGQKYRRNNARYAG